MKKSASEKKQEYNDLVAANVVLMQEIPELRKKNLRSERQIGA